MTVTSLVTSRNFFQPPPVFHSTEAGQSQPETQALEAADGVLALALDSTPVFVQPAP